MARKEYMATKTQREFKKQMKELEKEGKLPQGYYARRRVAYTGGGVSILVILGILWYSGILNMIFYAVISLFFPNYYNQQYPAHMADNPSSPEAVEISTYYNAAQDVDTLIADVYLDIYKRFYDNKPVSEETFSNHKKDLQASYESIATDNVLLKDLSDNYKEDLDVTGDMLDFAIEHDKALTEQDKRYLDTLSEKSRALSKKRGELWDKLWNGYYP